VTPEGTLPRSLDSSQFNPFHLISSPSHLLPRIRRCALLSDIFVLPIRATYFPNLSRTVHTDITSQQHSGLPGSNPGTHTANVYGLSSVPPGQGSTSSSRPPSPSTSLRNQHSTATPTPGPIHLHAVCDQPPSQGSLPECRIPG
jgi:hypothetical protein